MKRRLPKLTTPEISEAQQKWCGAWLHCREIQELVKEAVLEPEDAVASGSSDLPSLKITAFSEEPLRVGQIRLLASSVTPESDTPVYIAVLKEWEDGGFLVAPYSRYPVPAFTSELWTGWEEAPLATLCIWNALTLETDHLDHSWMVDQLSDQEVQDAVDLFHHFAFGEELPERISERIGAPILYEDDPRIPYQTEQLERCSGLGRLQGEIERNQETQWTLNLIEEAERIAADYALPAAADDGEHPPMKAVFIGEGETRAVLARADEPLSILPGQEDPPDVQWSLEEPDASSAGSTVQLVDLESRRVLAEGSVSPTGEYITLFDCYTENILKPVTHQDRLILMVIRDAA